jgi:hypothetical protein
VNAAEAPVLRKKLRRKEMVALFEKLAPTVIAIEACGASYHWARLLQSFGHRVKLIPPQLVKPFGTFAELDESSHEAGIELCFAELKDPVKDKLKRFGLFSQSGENSFLPTIGAAVRSYLDSYGVDWVDRAD